jgi:hypothetical protein
VNPDSRHPRETLKNTRTVPPPKECRKCGLEKPRAEFPANRGSKDGLSSWCKNCHLTAVRESRARAAERARKEAWKRQQEANARLGKQARQARPEASGLGANSSSSSWASPLAEGRRRADNGDVARHDSAPFNFPQPELCFFLAAVDLTFGVLLFFMSVGAGVVMTLIASLFAVGGMLKKRRMLK